MLSSNKSKGEALKLLLVISVFFAIKSYAADLSTNDLKKLAEKELTLESSLNKKSQTVKIKNIPISENKSRPSSQWSLGYHFTQLSPVRFKVKSVSLTTPEITQSQMFYLKAQTPIIEMLNQRYLFLTGSLSYGRTETEFQSVANYQDGSIEVFQPTVGISFKFYNYKKLSFNFESGYAVHLYNVKNKDSNFQQTANAQSLQNSVTSYWQFLESSGVEFSLTQESLLSGDFEPLYSFRVGYRGAF